MSYLAFRISPEDNPILTYGEYIVLSRGGGRGQKAEDRGRGGISNIQHRISNVQVRRLIELDSYADMGIFEHILALNSNHFTALNPGKLPLLPRQTDCTRKIDFDSVPEPNRSGYGNGNESPCFTNVIASAVKKSVGFWQPHTYRPGKVGSCVLTLFN